LSVCHRNIVLSDTAGFCILKNLNFNNELCSMIDFPYELIIVQMSLDVNYIYQEIYVGFTQSFII